MPFLACNGIELEVAAGGLRRSEDYPGDQARAFDGTRLACTRAVRRKWTVELVPQTFEIAEALVGLCTGQGHYWDFEHGDATNDFPFSADGFAAMGGEFNDSVEKFGDLCLSIAEGESANFYLSPFSDWTERTALGWSRDSGSWVYCATVETSDTGVNSWQAGSDSGAVGSWGLSNLTLSYGYSFDNCWDFINAGTGSQYVDDVVLLPYACPSAWIVSWGTPTAAWPSKLPLVYLSGDAIPGGATVSGRVSSLKALHVGASSKHVLELEFTEAA